MIIQYLARQSIALTNVEAQDCKRTRRTYFGFILTIQKKGLHIPFSQPKSKLNNIKGSSESADIQENSVQPFKGYFFLQPNSNRKRSSESNNSLAESVQIFLNFLTNIFCPIAGGYFRKHIIT